MAPDQREWSLGGPARALLWWPPISFLLLAAFPNAGVIGIAVSGALLALVGSLVWALDRWARRTEQVENPAPAAAEAELVHERATAGRRAA